MVPRALGRWRLEMALSRVRGDASRRCRDRALTSYFRFPRAAVFAWISLPTRFQAWGRPKLSVFGGGLVPPSRRNSIAAKSASIRWPVLSNHRHRYRPPDIRSLTDITISPDAVSTSSPASHSYVVSLLLITLPSQHADHPPGRLCIPMRFSDDSYRAALITPNGTGATRALM